MKDLLVWFVELAIKGGPAIRDRISDVLMRQQISGLTFAERFMLGETQVGELPITASPSVFCSHITFSLFPLAFSTLVMEISTQPVASAVHGNSADGVFE